jgi:hypothetical protein
MGRVAGSINVSLINIGSRALRETDISIGNKTCKMDVSRPSHASCRFVFVFDFKRSVDELVTTAANSLKSATSYIDPKAKL